jgi:poly-beta-1,6-N-acetyl-D-glucosamine synthase
MIPLWLLVTLVFGVNFTLWSAVGALRLADSWLDRFRLVPRTVGSQAHRRRRAVALPAGSVPLERVAVLMAAHNEAVVIDDSLAAITALVPARNVFVVSDASTDDTVNLARRRRVHVVPTAVNVGKAGALEFGIRVYDLVARYDAVLLLDADTRLDPGYFEAALPLLDDPAVVAVAGCARSQWRRSSTARPGGAPTPPTSCPASPACTGRRCCRRSRSTRPGW